VTAKDNFGVAGLTIGSAEGFSEKLVGAVEDHQTILPL